MPLIYPVHSLNYVFLLWGNHLSHNAVDEKAAIEWVLALDQCLLWKLKLSKIWQLRACRPASKFEQHYWQLQRCHLLFFLRKVKCQPVKKIILSFGILLVSGLWHSEPQGEKLRARYILGESLQTLFSKHISIFMFSTSSDSWVSKQVGRMVSWIKIFYTLEFIDTKPLELGGRVKLTYK